MNIDVGRYYELSLKDRARGIANVAQHIDEHVNEALCGNDFYLKVDIDYIRDELSKIESEFKNISQLNQFLAERAGKKE